ISFDYKINNKAYDSPVYIVIKHTDYKLNEKKVNFLASTCDFDELKSKGLIDGLEFGKRPICYPLGTDYNYPGTDGSGIAFRVNKVTDTIQTIHVFLFAEFCVKFRKPIFTEPYEPFYFIAIAKTELSSTYKFSINMYKEIRQVEQNESRFVDSLGSGEAVT